MALRVAHNFVSAVGDGPDPSQVQPSHWNQDHVLTGFGGAASLNVGTTAGTVAAGDDPRLVGALDAGVAASTYAKLAGGNTFTGTQVMGVANVTTLQISGTDIFARANVFTANQMISGAAGSQRNLWFGTLGSTRWGINATSTAESGGNAGTDLNFNRFSDAGAFIDAPLAISRSTGLVSMGAGLNVTGTITGTTINATALQIGGTDILARANIWTGQQTFGNGTGQRYVIINGAAAQERAVMLYTNGVVRWKLLTDSSAESGGNAGSDFYIQGFSDAGGFLANQFSINRATGLVTLSTGVTVPAGGLRIAGTDILARSNVWTAQQQFGNGTTSAQVILNGAAGQNRLVEFWTNGVARWKVLANSTAEGGSNAGSDFQINSYSDAGASLGSAISITRANNAVALTGDMTISKGNAAFTLDATANGATFILRALAGNNRGIVYGTGASNRWFNYIDTSAESGGNAGANWQLQSYDDAGSLIGLALSVVRATRAVTATVSLFSPVINGTVLQYGGTDILARGNTWTADQTISKATAAFTLNATSGNAAFTMSAAAGTNYFIMNAPAGNYRLTFYKTNNVERWRLGVDVNTESGGNAGASFMLQSYDDAGAFVGNALYITRATMAAAFGGAITAPSATFNGTVATATINASGNVIVTKSDAQVVLNATSNNAFLILQGLSGQYRAISFQTGTGGSAERWRMFVDTAAESGSNAGSNFQLQCMTDAAGGLFTAFSIARNTGIMTFGATGGLVVGAPTGGAKGNGSINASAVYDDNVLLTCYVLEAAQTGKIDHEKWDGYCLPKPESPQVGGAKVSYLPPTHDKARQFEDRMDELDLATYISKWKATGVLPGMPSPEEWEAADNKMATGEVIQRMWETIELFAVHMDQLNSRIQ